LLNQDALFHHKGAHWTDLHAVQAGTATGINERDIVEGTYPGVQAAVRKIDGADAILLTGPDALAAHHALVGIIDEQRMTGIHRQQARHLPEPLQLEFEPFSGSYSLQLTVLVLGAIAAVQVMVGEQQLKRRPSQPHDRRGPGVHYHALRHHLGAGSDRAWPSFDLYKAETAAAKRQFGFPNGTEVGYVDIVIEGRPQDSLSFAGCNLPAVDR